MDKNRKEGDDIMPDNSKITNLRIKTEIILIGLENRRLEIKEKLDIIDNRIKEYKDLLESLKEVI